MTRRRRIDWSVILRKDPPVPKWGRHKAPSDVVELLLTCGDLLTLNDRDALLKRSVEIALHTIGLTRAGIFLYDEQLDLMLGSWGTDLRLKVVDEHHAMFQLGEPSRRVFQNAMLGEAQWTMVEDCPIVINNAEGTKVVGRGWVVCTPIRSARAPLGMMYNDAGLTSAAVDPEKQRHAAVLCTLLGLRLDALRGSGKAFYGPSGRHPTVAAALRMLESSGSPGGFLPQGPHRSGRAE